MLRFVGILRDRQSTPFLDAPDADRAVGVRAREDDRRRMRSVGISQRAEEQVDRYPPPVVAVQIGELEVAIAGCQIAKSWRAPKRPQMRTTIFPLAWFDSIAWCASRISSNRKTRAGLAL